MTDVLNSNISQEAIQQFKATLLGPLLQPGSEGYDAARVVWNAMIDRKPALIVRCKGVADVIRAVNFAREHNLLLSVRGGGHNVTGSAVCEGGLMIDLSLLKGLRVDPLNRTAQAQAGLTLGELNHETQAFGLAVTTGQVSQTGIAGLTLGGGIGSLMRKYGLTIDNLLSVDIVTADGRFLHTSSTENPDLFWGVRGGGGNFGIVTSFEYRLHPVGPLVAGGMALYPASQAKELLKFYRGYMAEAPDEVMAFVLFMTAPPEPFVPVEVQFTPIIGVLFSHCGPLEEGLLAIEKWRSFGRPAVDMLGPIPYEVVQKLADGSGPFGRNNYVKEVLLDSLGDEVIDLIIGQAQLMASPFSNVLIFPMGGAVSRVGEEETAFAHRQATFGVDANAAWLDPQENEQHITWARGLATVLQPFANGRVYINLESDMDETVIKRAYPAATYKQLVALKNKYDPTNLFRMNQNVKPVV